MLFHDLKNQKKERCRRKLEKQQKYPLCLSLMKQDEARNAR
jgi:hypothetical protein